MTVKCGASTERRMFYVFVAVKDRNSHHLSDINPSPATTSTYEELQDVNTERPVSYEQLPTAAQTAGVQHDYYNINSSSNVTTVSPYELLSNNTQPPVIYQQLAA